MKRFQNKVAESRKTLPAAVAIGIGIWLLAGLVHQQWWIQFACFLLSIAVMTELDNSNALIRIFSRMTPVSFMAFSCSAAFLFPSVTGAIMQLCIITSLYTLFNCYQDQQATGWTFYTFLLLGLGSLAEPQALWLAPLYWLMMLTTIYCTSWRTLTASLLGLLCPYWFVGAWILFACHGDFTLIEEHFSQLVSITLPADYQSIGLPRILSAAFITILTLVGSIHFVRYSFRDKIRTRQLYSSLMLLYGFAALLAVLQPQYIDVMIRIMIITGSPIAAHFLALTSTRFTNIAFSVVIGAAALLTVFNVWMLSFHC